MPYNGSGVYAPSGADFPVVSGTLIQSSKYNNVVNDIASALSLVLVADGQRAASADLPMGGFKLTNIADATARNNYPSMGQVQDGAGIWCGTAGGTLNALTISPTPAITAYATGQRFEFKSGATTNTTAVTLAVSGLGAKAVQAAGAALAAGDIVINQLYSVIYDGTAFQLSRFSAVAPTAAIPGVVAIVANKTLTRADIGITQIVNTGPVTFTLPASASCVVGDTWVFKNMVTTSVLIACAGADVLDSIATYRIPHVGSCKVMYIGGTSFILSEKPSVNVGDWSWAGYSAANTGWVKAGQVVSRTTYGSLFAVYGTTYGVGDGSTTFGLPTHQGSAPIGAGTGAGLTARSLGQTGGEESHILSIAELAAHTHPPGAGATFVNAQGGAVSANSGGTASFPTSAATGSTGSGTAHNTMQPFFVGELYIKL